LSQDNQDGDSVNSQLALLCGLKQKNKKVYWVSAHGQNSKFDYLEDNYQALDVKSIAPILHQIDLVILTDANQKHEYQNAIDILPNILSKPIIVLDHHNSEQSDFSNNDLYIVDNTIAATTIIVYFVLLALDINISPKIASYLLGGIYADTAGFINANTDSLCLDVASKLTNLGASPHHIHYRFKKHNAPSLEEINRSCHIFLERTKLDHDIAYIKLEHEDFLGLGTNNIRQRLLGWLEDIHGISTALIIKENRHDYTFSIRTKKSNLNLGAIAAQFGCGGHNKSAGGKIENHHLMPSDFLNKMLDLLKQ
jgi:phosphoesterase RecJ-like protein